ncbi:MAG: Rrf2 family transcriptional regulator [Deltaproteobacteria bacterium]|nr:Rrf2 family transcriptional regulator [Deltaproteobacteria bacterium]MBW2306609.1 Rrf2 family transcriptional regulator [Deltaproteobacteria bacterium]
MQISCRGRYATRALIELALHHGKAPLPLSSIAQNQDISKKYLQQLMGILKRAGLVRVVKGKKGGFLLAQHPSKITLANILYPVEGEMSIVDCVSDRTLCYRSPECIAHQTWLGLSEAIKRHLESITLADMIKKGISVQAAGGNWD